MMFREDTDFEDAILTFPHFKQTVWKTISLFHLHVVTSPPVLVGWEATAAGCTGNTSSSDSRTKMTASPLTFIKHWAWEEKQREHTVIKHKSKHKICDC